MDRPRRTLRSTLPRATKFTAPVRVTRSSTAYLNSLSTSSDNNDLELEIDSDSSGSDSSFRRPPRTTTTITTRKRKSNDDDDDEYKSAPPSKTARRTRSQTKTNAPVEDIIPLPCTPKSIPDTPAAASPSTPIVHPPWGTIPYHVLKCVFDNLASPIRDPSSRLEDVSEAVSSLLSAARACKAFAEPALANLYKCPPFYHQWRYTKAPHTSFSQLIDTLGLPADTTFINYHTKVEILRLEVQATLAQKHNVNYLEMPHVVRNLPRLSQLEFYHVYDEAPYRKLDERIRFKCSADDLLQIVAPQTEPGQKNERTELKSWRWNARLTSESLSLDKLAEFHLNPSFATLKKVAFVNYQLPSWGMTSKLRVLPAVQEKDQRTITRLPPCISALPELEHLILESSTLVNGSLLNQLPKTLKHLELINCWEVTAEDIQEYLLTNGNRLQSLTLNHCQSLSLAFLPVLRTACPNLQHLYMDMSYFRHHEHYADNKPEYETLLTEDQVPTWPSSMESIQIFHMRKWGRKAAETFFGSLLQSAADLPHLRCLAFRAALDISWRQRRELREFWVDKMVKVFKRKPKPPSNLKTLRPSPTELRQQKRKEPKLQVSKPVALPKRRSTRLADLSLSPAPTSSESEITKSGLARASALNKELKRLRGSGKLLKEQQDADDEESEDELTADHSDRSLLNRKVRKISRFSPGEDEFVHGMCDVVDIQVDNHRPTERQYDMEDFLDSPEESDPDWDGGDADVFD
ncbi:hypothetical protein F4819DRAFT_469818 [Hypoxylon fuscum]|nr:hypothetical protein F4819DRAFT_469818 [Hypoxylon fuscum]